MASNVDTDSVCRFAGCKKNVKRPSGSKCFKFCSQRKFEVFSPFSSRSHVQIFPLIKKTLYADQLADNCRIRRCLREADYPDGEYCCKHTLEKPRAKEDCHCKLPGEELHDHT